MKTEYRQEYRMLAAITATAVVTVTLLYIQPRVSDIGAISSRQVDNMLYRRLDEYQQAYRESTHLQAIVTTALTSPADLDSDERRIYIDHERRFFGGWEAAWEHHLEGHLDAERFSVWDNWYIAETRRRPSFAWTENRKRYAKGFADHVDDSLR